MKLILTKFAYLITATLVFILFTVVPAEAYLTNPTSLGLATYTANNIMILRNLAETGDSLYVFHYSIPVASDNYPVETATETIYFELFDDAGNLKATFYPYVFSFFDNNGYGDGIASVYFAASDNAPLWGSAATLRISGWPVYYSGLTPVDYVLQTGDYSLVTSQEANQSALKSLVLLWCDRLGSIYQDTGVVLKTSSDSGTVLSDYGEIYFNGCIPGLQTLCPQLFFIQLYIPTQMDTNYDMTMGDTFAARGNTMWRTGFTRIGTAIGVSGTVALCLIIGIINIIICVVVIRKGWGIEAGAAIGVFIGGGAAILFGGVLFAILMVAALLAVFGLVWLLLLRRTS